MNLDPYRPEDDEGLRRIHDAFIELMTLSLSPVREYMRDVHDEDVSYDEIRIARLFLSEKSRKKIEEQMLYESEGIAL